MPLLHTTRKKDKRHENYVGSSNCYVIHCTCAVAFATQNTTSSLPANLEHHSKNPASRDQPITIISKGVSSSAPKPTFSKLGVKQTDSSGAATAKQSGARRQCSVEEIERKKQEAMRRRRSLPFKM